jgi:hypothetical protein
VEAIPNIFDPAEQLIFVSIIFYEEICYFYALLAGGLRRDSAFNLGNMHSPTPQTRNAIFHFRFDSYDYVKSFMCIGLN